MVTLAGLVLLAIESISCGERAANMSLVEALFSQAKSLDVIHGGDWAEDAEIVSREIPKAELARVYKHLSEDSKSLVSSDSRISLVHLLVTERRYDNLILILKVQESKNVKTKNGATPLSLACKLKDIKSQVILTGGSLDNDPKVFVDLSDSKLILGLGSSSREFPITSGSDFEKTPTGIFVVTEKRANYVSREGKHLPFFIRLSGTGFGIHAGRVSSDLNSRGCVRLGQSSAEFVFNELAAGDLIRIEE